MKIATDLAPEELLDALLEQAQRVVERQLVAVQGVQDVDVLAQLPGLRVAEPHPVAHPEVPRYVPDERRLDLAGAFLGVELQTNPGLCDRFIKAT
mgnify:CR=1 FL=1